MNCRANGQLCSIGTVSLLRGEEGLGISKELIVGIADDIPPLIIVRRLWPLVRVCQNQLALRPGYASEEYTTLVYLFAKELFIFNPQDDH